MSNNDEDELTPVEKIKANAELVIRVMHGENLDVELNYDAKSVKWIEGYIERQRLYGDPALVDQLVDVIGCFVGECICHEFGGEWAQVNGLWGIRLPSNNVAFPIAKVAKQFKDGVSGGESVYSFYQVIPMLSNFQLSTNSARNPDPATDGDPQSE